MTVAIAAQRLGITKEAVRKRIHRGTLRSDKDEDGTVRVYITTSGTPSGTTSPDRDELVVELRDRVRSLERRLDEEGESRRRADTIIAQLTQANTALNERLRELEAPAAQAPPASGGAVEEARKEVARRLVGALFGLAIFIPSSITTVLSYFNGASTTAFLGAATAVFGIVTALVGTYFGIKSSADAGERAQKIAAEANISAEQTAREAQGEPRDDG